MQIRKANKNNIVKINSGFQFGHEVVWYYGAFGSIKRITTKRARLRLIDLQPCDIF